MADTIYAAILDANPVEIKAYIDGLAIVMTNLSITALTPKKVLVVIGTA